MAVLACVDLYAGLSPVRLGAHGHQCDIDGGTALPCSSGTVGDAAGGGRGERAWPVKCECMISGGRKEKSASSTCATEDEERGHRLHVRLVKSSPVRRLHECLLVPVCLLTTLQLETMKSCCSFLLPGGSWSLVAANGRGTCTASRPMLLAASGTCEILVAPARLACKMGLT
jgi:hypothetical protein